jgi:hypothetical protein
MFASIGATEHERTLPRPGDDLVSLADVVMDRAFTLDAPPETVWPWLAQLGKRRAGWYLPRLIERFLPPGRRAAWEIHPEWQHLKVGDIIPDYGGKHATFHVAQIQAPQSIVYTSRRGKVSLTWSITLEPLEPLTADRPTRTRVSLRLRMAPVKWKRLCRHRDGLIVRHRPAVLPGGRVRPGTRPGRYRAGRGQPGRRRPGCGSPAWRRLSRGRPASSPGLLRPGAGHRPASGVACRLWLTRARIRRPNR